MTPISSLSDAFDTLPNLIWGHALAAPERPAVVVGEKTLSYQALDQRMDQVAAALAAHGLKKGDAIAICAASSVEYACVFMGALRAGVVVAPLAPSSTAQSLGRMVADARAALVFTDTDNAALVAEALATLPVTRLCIGLDDAAAGLMPLSHWLATGGAHAAGAQLSPQDPFNIIYSSGTTGEPKGIVQSHGMRWAHIQRGNTYGYGPETVTLLSTPLYSNTTLVVFIPTLAFGGTVLMMPKFQAQAYLQLASTRRVTHTMLVPVQYQRLLALPDFDAHDLSSYHVKFCTSAPFSPQLKAEVLKRWPGGLVEFYGMTEGGGSCILEAHKHPDKLHTVGQPSVNHDIRLIDDDGQVVASNGADGRGLQGVGVAGEVVGHSGSMMTGYHGQPEKTREAEWFDDTGKRFIRTGDIGRFDADGFLILFDRKKDMIISGGFNIYPSDLEGILQQHPAVLDVAVVGVPSEQWGETPVACVVLKPGQALAQGELLKWVNDQVGKTQRLAQLHLMAELPRSPIGKILKRELRDQLAGSAKAAAA
jgi:acyl-CoA synthetase (AMP-forming)/AMP-acid ligase II